MRTHFRKRILLPEIQRNGIHTCARRKQELFVLEKRLETRKKRQNGIEEKHKQWDVRGPARHDDGAGRVLIKIIGR